MNLIHLSNFWALPAYKKKLILNVDKTNKMGSRNPRQRKCRIEMKETGGRQRESN